MIAVGLHPDDLRTHFRDCAVAARIDNDAGVDNQEAGTPVVVCQSPRRPWSAVWDALRHLG